MLAGTIRRPIHLFRGIPRSLRHAAASGCASLLAAAIGKRSECRQRGMKKPTEPYTLPFSANSHSIQSVVPVSRPDERQTMGSDSETRFKCTRAMFVERPSSFEIVG